MRRFGYPAWKLPLIGLLFVMSSCSSGSLETSEGRPNIIFLMDDQHRWDAFGIENDAIITPTIDRLSSEGVRFTQAVCQAPMCIPSRNSMMLGLYPNQLGVTRNAKGIPDSLLPAKPLAQVFADAGYETAGFGKTHWGIQSSTRGFQTRFAAELREDGAMMMNDLDPEAKQRYVDEISGYGAGEENPSGYIGRTSALPEGDHRDGWVFTQCLEYLEEREDDRPLFLYLSFLKPHAGHNVPMGFENRYNLEETVYKEQPPWNKDRSQHAEGVNRREMYVGFWKVATESQWKEMTMRYYANCTWIDDMFGRTLSTLEQKGLLDNAIIIYVSDHGEMLGERFYRFNKYCLYDGSVRVPMVISGSALPEKWRGKEDNRSAELTDVYPTLLESAGIHIPPHAVGMNLLDEEADREASFCALHERPYEASFMLRTQSHKLILSFQKKQDASEYTANDIIGGEFYDLLEDPQEWDDRFYEDADQPKKEKMMAQLLSRLKTMDLLIPKS